MALYEQIFDPILETIKMQSFSGRRITNNVFLFPLSGVWAINYQREILRIPKVWLELNGKVKRGINNV